MLQGPKAIPNEDFKKLKKQKTLMSAHFERNIPNFYVCSLSGHLFL